MFPNFKQQWLANLRGDLLSGLVVALALIPESISFSIIAGVDPKVGLYSSFCIAVVAAIFGGRPGMISGATGAMALLMVTLVKDHGLQYLLAATILTGIFQIIAGFLKLGNLMRFVSRSVVTGFVNALAILIFMAQLPELTNVTWHVYAVCAAGLAIIYLFPLLPRVGKIIPSPLVCIITMTIVVVIFKIDIRTVGDMGQLPDTLPVFLIPDIPLNWETLMIIGPTSLSMAAVGLLESMMTTTIIEDLTDTKSDRNRECKGQGLANISAGFLGGMAGCALIGQSMINIKSGGRLRLSTFCAGLFLLIMVVFMSDWISLIPMAALVAVMIMVSIGTFSWSSITNMPKYPLSTNIVMLATVIVVIFTHNLAKGVFVGVLLATLFFANKIAQFLMVSSELEHQNSKGESFSTRKYKVVGQVFFASTKTFNESFDFKEVVDLVIIDLSQAHFWDVSAVNALDQVILKFYREGIECKIEGLSEASKTIVDKFAVHNDPQALEKMLNNH